jgi:glyoxylase-like metal-dependent hydrolase (beta-lactamase superfamily II)
MAEIIGQRPGIFLVQADLGDFSVRGAVVAGKTRAVVWDTLSRPDHMTGVAELFPDLPFDVVYSHGDWDHVLGTSGLSRAPEEIIAQEECRGRLLRELPGVLSALAKGGEADYQTFPILAPTRSFETGLELDLGGVSMELGHLDGHTPDTVVGFLPRWNVLLAGDAVETPLPFLNRGSRVRVWINGLNALAGTMDSGSEPATVIPSHGSIGGTELLRETAAYLEEIQAGEDPMTGRNLSSFYRETHASNLLIASPDSRIPDPALD